MSLSLLRVRLHQDGKLLRNIRISAMLVLFALLVIGLVPTTTAYRPVATWTRWSRPIQGTSAATGFPDRCFWTADKNSGPDWVVGEAVISYISLVGSYVWNLARNNNTSRKKKRLWG